MKSWIKRSLMGLTAAAVVLGGLVACGSHSHWRGDWSEERVAQARTKAVDKITDKLELNAAQKLKLSALADEIVASRKAFRGDTVSPRQTLQALVAGDRFDQAGAQRLLEEKTQAVQGNGPRMLSAFGDFFDSLTPAQQQQVRNALEKRGHGWWGRG